MINFNFNKNIIKQNRINNGHWAKKSFEERYIIYPDGRIYSNITKRFLKPSILNGYAVVRINNKQTYVHKIIAEKFIPNLNNYTEINHIDENKLNNNVDNLEWCNRKHNIRHSLSKKVYCYNYNGELIKVYDTTTDTKVDGFNRASVGNVCNGIRNTHHGYTFSYKPLTKEEVISKFK